MAKKKSEEKNQIGDNGANEGDAYPSDEEPNFSDPEGFVDDVTDEGKADISGIHVLPFPIFDSFIVQCVFQGSFK